MSATDVIRRLQPALAGVEGIQLFMQPVQDLTVEDRVSRTQYQYSLEDPDGSELNTWAPRLVDALRARRELADVSSDQQDQGLGTALVIDRSTASRLGVTPQAIDNTLYDAFGQRQVSTMFTQLNQYRVVLEVKPEFRRSAAALRDIYVTGRAPERMGPAGGGAARRHDPRVSHDGSARGLTPGAVPGGDAVVQPGAGDGPRRRGRRGRGRRRAASGCPRASRASFQGTAQAFRASLANEPLLIAAALVAVYIVLGVLYESYIHPLTILSTLPSAGVGAILALLVCREELSVIALIGIILLIGIVKKNAIMMIDFALEAERSAGPESAGRHLPGLPAALPPDHDDHDGGAAGRAAAGARDGEWARSCAGPLGIAIVGGLILSQLLTLYTTPVIYLAFDRLARRVPRGIAARCGIRHEHLRALHHAAGGHHAA